MFSDKQINIIKEKKQNNVNILWSIKHLDSYKNYYSILT